MVIAAKKFTSADLESLPDDGNRYEIIEGELYVSRQPRYELELGKEPRRRSPTRGELPGGAARLIFGCSHPHHRNTLWTLTGSPAESPIQQFRR